MTQPLIESGDLVVLGLVQEQHPERAQLYAQWQQLDWPILWDPFNTTGATAVPNAYLIDEHGVLQGKRLNAESLAAFMEAEFETPESDVQTSPLKEQLWQTPDVSEEALRWDPKLSVEIAYWLSLSNAIWVRNEHEAVDHLGGMFGLGEGAPAMIPDGDDYFRLGVAYRMRYDSDGRQPGDFQAAIDAWERALEMAPNQYIWRRRIQQYGPMSDKPYPFYGWVATAQREITERVETPIEIPQALTQAELGTEGSAFVPEGEPANPDPDARITTDAGIVTITSATTPDTQNPGTRRVLIEFIPGSTGHWNNEAEPLTVWIDAESLPEGWSVESPMLIHQPGDDIAASSDEPRIIDFGLTHPADAAGTFTLTGYALYNVCEADGLGQCLYRRQAFEVVVELE
ncbi:MAG: hypothetical protein AAGA29_00255 [Planctomycetota bacterium]